MTRRAAWTALSLSLALTLAGCASAPRPSVSDGTAPAPAETKSEAKAAPPPPQVEELPLATAEPTQAAPEAAESLDEWARIRAGFRFAECERDSVRAAIRRILRPRDRLPATMARVMPMLLLVRDELDRAGVPLEFVFLPMVESEYTPVASTGNRPAGMWQIMPITARGLGLVVDADYDARLDAVVATRAAVAHLAALAQRFDGDWRLANMAYNAGEFRVRGALRATRRSPAARGPSSLALPAITHAHLAKLEAWSCIVAEPQRHEVALPGLPEGERLVEVVADSALDATLAARLARETPAAFRLRHPAHRRGVIAAGRPVLVRAGERERFERLLLRIPPPLRVAWSTASKDVASAGSGIEPDVLAELNDGASSRHWLVPRAAAPIGPRVSAGTSAAPAMHTVRSGESLWRIARRHGVSVAALRAWNDLAHGALLRPGDVLRLAPKRRATAR